MSKNAIRAFKFTSLSDSVNSMQEDLNDINEIIKNNQSDLILKKQDLGEIITSLQFIMHACKKQFYLIADMLEKDRREEEKQLIDDLRRYGGDGE